MISPPARRGSTRPRWACTACGSTASEWRTRGESWPIAGGLGGCCGSLAPSAGPTNFARSTQPSPPGAAAQLEEPRSRSAAALNVHPRTPRAAASLGPRLARHLARHSAKEREVPGILVGAALAGGQPYVNGYCCACVLG